MPSQPARVRTHPSAHKLDNLSLASLELRFQVRASFVRTHDSGPSTVSGYGTPNDTNSARNVRAICTTRETAMRAHRRPTACRISVTPAWCAPRPSATSKRGHVARFAAELHADQVNRLAPGPVLGRVVALTQLRQRGSRWRHLHHLELEQVHVPAGAHRHVQPAVAARLLDRDLAPQRRSTGASYPAAPQCTNPGRTLPTLPHRSGSAQWQGSTVHAPFIARLAISLSESGLAVAPRRRGQKPSDSRRGETREGRAYRLGAGATCRNGVGSLLGFQDPVPANGPRRTGVNHSLSMASIHAYLNQ